MKHFGRRDSEDPFKVQKRYQEPVQKRSIYFLVVLLFKTLIRPSGGGCDAMVFLCKTKKVEGVVLKGS